MTRSHLSVLLIPLAVAAVGIVSIHNVHGVEAAIDAQAPAASPPPARIGNQIAGTFADASGHSGQSHLVYAENARVWWLFTLTSDADSPGGSNHIVRAYRSSGSDLATAVWTAATDSPGASVSGGGGFLPDGSMGGGRALGVAYVNNAPVDIIHAEIAMAFDGQSGVTSHIRARLTATAIVWESWNAFAEGAATWTLPRAVGLGLSTGNYIHSGGPTLQQEVDANARRSSHPDAGATWNAGFSPVAVIDNSMINASNAIAFAPLANDAMLAVYDNGGGISTCYNCGQTGVPEPNLSNLGFTKSNANGSWPTVAVATQAPGDGQVFSTTATIDQNDWALVPIDPATIRAYRRNAGGTGIDAAAYNTASNTWSSAPAPLPFGAGQAFKSRAGLFGAHDASATWLFVVNTDAANSILYSRHDGTTWSPWRAVPGTDSGTHARRFIAGAPIVAADQIGLIWTEGSGPYDVFATSLATVADVTPPSVYMLEPADGSTVFGAVSISASASDNRGVGGVQFKLDGVNIGPLLTTSPYQYTWDSRTVGNGTHSIAAAAVDGAGNTSSASASVTVSNRPVISAVNASPVSTSSESITWTTDVDSTSGVDFGLTAGYGTTAGNATLVKIHQVTLAGLIPGTTYHYQVRSTDAAGNAAVTGDFAFTMSPADDTTPPTVSITAPAGGATLSGPAVTVSASAADNVAIAGVQFMLDGLPLIAEDTTSPYTISWNTTTNTNAVHALTAIARDAAGNTALAAAVTVTVNNTFIVPSIVGLTQTAAATAISNAGLTVGTVTTAASTTVPAGFVISQTPAAGTAVAPGSPVALVISFGASTAPLAVDAVIAVDGSHTVTTPVFTTAAAGGLVLAFAASDGPAQATQRLTMSGAGLDWQLLRRANMQSGTAEIWSADAPTPLLAATVTSTQAVPGFDQSLTVVVFSGAAGTGVSVGAGATSGTPRVSLTTTRAGSLVYGVGNDWATAEARIVGADQTMIHEWIDSRVGDTFWVQALSAPVADAGLVATIDDTSPATDRWNLAAIEILARSPVLIVTVPHVVNEPEAAATTAIQSSGLTLGTVTTASSWTVPAGSVISQHPIGGTQVPSGTAVALVVSSGALLVATPDVVGLTQEAATTAITNAGLAAGVVTTALSTTIPAGTVISQSPIGGATVAAGTMVALVVSSGALEPPVVLAVDKVVFSDGVGTRVTAPFSTESAGELLVAFASANGPQNSTKQTLAVSGGGLAWTLVRRGNTEFGTAEIWSAKAPTRLANVAVMAAPALAGFSQSLTVVAFVGAGGTGATGAASAATGPSSVSLTTTRPGSLVYAVGNDSVRPVPRIMGPNLTMVHEWFVTSSTQAFWVQSRATAVAAAGSLETISNTGPTSGRWNLTAVEILVASTLEPLVSMPDVVGMKHAAATQAAEGQGNHVLRSGRVQISLSPVWPGPDFPGPSAGEPPPIAW